MNQTIMKRDQLKVEQDEETRELNEQKTTTDQVF